MLVISSREFRQNQKLYFDKADKGEQIIVQRGKDKSYALTPIGEDDMYFNKKMINRIKESAKQYSRRINRKHRLVYDIQGDIITVVILNAYSHYGDK